MTPNEVIKKLEEKGVKTSRSTLLRFEKMDLIPEPQRGSDGRGKGRYSEYPDETPHEYLASYVLLNKPYRLKPDNIAELRKFALRVSNGKCYFLKLEHEAHRISKMIYNEGEPVLWFFWWTIKILSEHNIEIPKFKSVIFPTILVPKGVNKLYDSLLEKAEERRKEKFRFLWEESISIKSIRSFYVEQLEHARQKIVIYDTEIANVNKLFNFLESLSEDRQRYIERITRIYIRRKSLRVAIEHKIKQMLPDHACYIIEIIQKQGLEYDADPD